MIGTHVVTVVPMYVFGVAPSKADFDKSAAQVSRFWAREVPGTKIVWRWKKPVRLSANIVCDNYRAMSYVASHAGVNPLKRHVHAMAYAPGCFPGGYGWIRNGFGVLWVGTSNAQVIAHELGHNMGLYHSNGLSCRDSANKPTPLSSRCDETEYSDPASVMGNLCDVTSSDCRVPGPDIAEFIGKAVSVPAHANRRVTLVNPGHSGIRTAYMQTKYGLLFIDPTPGGTDRDQNEINPGVEVRILTSRGNAVLTLPELHPTYNFKADVTLELGDSWVIPSTGTRLVVVAANKARVIVRFMPVTKNDPVPAAPMFTSAAWIAPGTRYLATWTKSPASNVVGYVVEVSGDVLIKRYRLAPSQTSVLLPVAYNGPLALRLWAVSDRGVYSKTSAYSVAVTPPYVAFKVLGFALDVYTNTPTSYVADGYVTGPGDLTWTTDPDTARKVTAWQFHVVLDDGTINDFTLPGAARSWTLSAAVMASLDHSQRVTGTPVAIHITPVGTDRQILINLYNGD